MVGKTEISSVFVSFRLYVFFPQLERHKRVNCYTLQLEEAMLVVVSEILKYSQFIAQ